MRAVVSLVMFEFLFSKLHQKTRRALIFHSRPVDTLTTVRTRLGSAVIVITPFQASESKFICGASKCLDSFQFGRRPEQLALARR